MPKVLVIHGAGMNMRGKVQTEIFGKMTLPEYDERIRGYAAELGVDMVELMPAGPDPAGWVRRLGEETVPRLAEIGPG